MIERHFRDVHQPQRYALRLRITVGHLNQLARRHLGRSAGIVIRERIALEAKRQLAHTDTSAAEIGYALGFRDPAYFARFFKREVGVSPSAFRAERPEAWRKSPGYAATRVSSTISPSRMWTLRDAIFASPLSCVIMTMVCPAA